MYCINHQDNGRSAQNYGTFVQFIIFDLSSFEGWAQSYNKERLEQGVEITRIVGILDYRKKGFAGCFD